MTLRHFVTSLGVLSSPGVLYTCTHLYTVLCTRDHLYTYRDIIQLPDDIKVFAQHRMPTRIGVLFVCTYLHIGWLRLVGSLQLQVSFAKEPYKRDYILQKRPIILRSLLIVATPIQNLYLVFVLWGGYGQ